MSKYLLDIRLILEPTFTLSTADTRVCVFETVQGS